jgi:type VI secretion system protein VasG
LLDEIEKAHPSIQELFYQVFDKGILVDSEGYEVDFSNTIIISTSNVAANEIIKICENSKDLQEPQLQLDEHIKNSIQPALLNIFKSAFIGRVNVIPYLPLSEEIIKKITQGLLDKLAYQIKQNYNVNLNLINNTIEKSINKELMKEIGVRHIKNLINQLILPKLAKALLQSMNANKKINQNFCFNFTLDMEK